MLKRIFSFVPVCTLALAAVTGSSFAVSNFTETYNVNDSKWLGPGSGASDYFPTGSLDNSGYISNTQTFTGSSSFGSTGFRLYFYGNSSIEEGSANDASGGAFAGNWLTSGVESISLLVRHNNPIALNFYTRLTPGGSAGANLRNSSDFAIAPNTWTTITIPIAPGSFSSYGAPGNTFNSVFTNIQDLQVGLYVTVGTVYSDLKMDIDNVQVTTVPEPTSLTLAALSGVGMLALRRRRS